MTNNYGLPSKSLFKSWTDAGLFAKRSDVIKTIDDLLDRYPALSTDFLRGLAAFNIVECCDEYEKKLVRENRGSRRLVGVNQLRKMASDEYKKLLPAIRAKVQFEPQVPNGADRARQNFRNLMHNPKFKALGEVHNRANRLDAKQLQDHEVLEALDEFHRVGHGLKGIHSVWLNDMTTTKNFWDYLEEYLIANPSDAPYRVKYLQENERRTYRVNFCGRVLYQGERTDREIFDTKHLAINTTNPKKVWGRGIYVVSIDNEVYSGGSFSTPVRTDEGGVDLTKVGDIFHHSSFLMGKPVLCAGEWVVENGGLLTINPQSGHYRAPVSRFQAFLLYLKRQGMALNRTTVEWEFNGSLHYYNAEEFANAKQVSFNNAPYHNNAPLPELQSMRNASLYKGNRPAPPIPVGNRPAPPIPVQNNNNSASGAPRRWAAVQTNNGFRR